MLEKKEKFFSQKISTRKFLILGINFKEGGKKKGKTSEILKILGNKEFWKLEKIYS